MNAEYLSTLHHPYINFFMVSLIVSAMTDFFIPIARSIHWRFNLCNVNVE